MTEDNNRRVYVGNLAWRVKWQDLKDHMKQAGEVKYAEVMQSNGKSKGCGIVEFFDAESAARAIKDLNDSELHDRKMFVREDRENRDLSGGASAGPASSSSAVPVGGGGGGGGDQSGARRSDNRFFGRSGVPSVSKETYGRQLYVSNLPWSVGWQDLKTLFGGADLVDRADVATDRDGRSKGFGSVLMKSEEAAQECVLRLNNHELQGRPIGVKVDNGPPENRSRTDQ